MNIFPPINFVVNYNIHKIPVHFKGNINTNKAFEVKFANCFQYVAPIVFGIISETTKINIVIIAETTPTILKPNIFIL